MTELRSIAEEADLITENHHEMTAEIMSPMLSSLLNRMKLAREELKKAELAVDRVADRFEMHHGGGSTQF